MANMVAPVRDLLVCKATACSSSMPAMRVGHNGEYNSCEVSLKTLWHIVKVHELAVVKIDPA